MSYEPTAEPVRKEVGSVKHVANEWAHAHGRRWGTHFHPARGQQRGFTETAHLTPAPLVSSKWGRKSHSPPRSSWGKGIDIGGEWWVLRRPHKVQGLFSNSGWR